MKRLIIICCTALSILAGNAAAAPGGLVTPGHIEGTGAGKTSLVSAGVYHVSGSFSDPTNGISGKYDGDLSNTGDYSTCAGGHVLGCLFDPVTQRQFGNCNLVSGSIKFQWSGGHKISLEFGSLSGHFLPSVCQEVTTPSVHDLQLSVFNNSPPAFPSHKLGDPDWADGFIQGVSNPTKAGNYDDSFTFSLDFGSYTNG